MAIVTQIPEVPVMGGDLSLRNFGPVDIPADRGVVVDPNNDFAVLLPTAGGSVAGAIGGTLDTIPVGRTGRVRRLGVKRLFADGPITRGDEVQLSSTAGKEGFVRVAAGTGTAIVGKALTSADDLDPIAIDMMIAKNA